MTIKTQFPKKTTPNEPFLKIENISKQYRLGVVGMRTLKHDFNRWWHLARGKEDPYAKIGETNDRATVGKSEYVWALKDINIEVQEGEVLGIIGKNGAGKSTLLKILSRVTSPTTGSIKSRGRIASLLEVGTGFHPELTGGENVYLNGAILGMTKTEIDSKFDEIVDFAGVARYIDTPVKRYSSGMTVRLAFAVAAHLEPEILVVDEVLAVGDADFQKKAIGKMQDINKGDGRTVLFVSHDLMAVQRICSRVVLIEDGRVKASGKPIDIIKKYIRANEHDNVIKEWPDDDMPGNEYARLKKVFIANKENELNYEFDVTEDIYIHFTYYDTNSDFKNTAILHIIDEFERTLFASNEFDNPEWAQYHNGRDGKVHTVCVIPGNLLSEGRYKVLIALGNYNPNMTHTLHKNALSFLIIDKPGVDKNRMRVGGKWPGLIRPILDWRIEKEYI